MTESPSPNKSAQWKRVLIGGLISASIGGICIVLIVGGIEIPLLALGFGLPILFYNTSSNIVDIMMVIVFWFMIGAVLTYLSTYFPKKNLVAIGLWLMVYVISYVISFFYYGMLAG
jgi:ABC-type transport system involved in multi-copper enzyme maturation permease subunit